MKKYNYGGYYNPNMQQGYMYNPQMAEQPQGFDMDRVVAESNQTTNAMPYVGGINRMVSSIFDPMRKNIFEKRNADGSLKNPGLAKVGMVLGSFLNPALALKTRNELGYYGLNMNKYTDALEGNVAGQKQGPQNLYYNQRPMGYNTYGYRYGGKMPKYQQGGSLEDRFQTLTQGGQGIAGNLQNAFPGLTTNMTGPIGPAIATTTGVGLAGINPFATAGMAMGYGGGPGMTTSNVQGINAERNAAGLGGGNPAAPSQDMTEEQRVMMMHTNQMNAQNQANNSWGFGDYAKAAINPAKGIDKFVQQNADTSTRGGQALSAASTMLTSNPLTAPWKALRNFRDQNRENNGPGHTGMRTSPAPGQEGQPAAPDTPSMYGYQNNTRGYQWGSQSPYGAYGNMPGGSYYGQPGGYGYMGGSPYYQTGGVGSYPTTYGGGYGGQAGGGYQPYYGYYKDGGTMGKANAMVDDGEIIVGDKPQAVAGGKIKTMMPGIHKVDGNTNRTDDVAVANEGEAYVYGNMKLDANTLNNIMKNSGLSKKYNKHVTEKEVADELAKELTAYRNRAGEVSEEEMNLVQGKYQKALEMLKAETDNMRMEKQMQTGGEYKMGGNLPKYFTGSELPEMSVTAQGTARPGMLKTGSLPTAGLPTNLGATGRDSSYYLDNAGEGFTLGEVDGGGSNIPWGQIASKIPDMINFGERQAGKYGTVNTQNYLQGLYNKGYRLTAPRFNPYGREALSGIQEAQGRTRAALDRTTDDELLGARRRDRGRKENVAGLSRGQQIAVNTASDAQLHRESRDISNRYLDRQGALAGFLANLFKSGHDIVEKDTMELRRIDDTNLRSEAAWDKAGLDLAMSKDNYLENIGKQAYNEYYINQGAPYAGMSGNPYFE